MSAEAVPLTALLGEQPYRVGACVRRRKHEKFAIAIAKGDARAQAYEDAGNPAGGANASAKSAGRS
jgi:hypothetical protein